MPGVAASVYIILLAVTLLSRPWTKQHRYFHLYISSAFLWSLSDFLLRSHYFEQHNLLLFRIVLITTLLWAVQLYLFSRSFLHLRSGAGAVFGYVSLAIFTALCAAGFIPTGVRLENGTIQPEYGYWFPLYLIPLLVLLIMGIYSLIVKLKTIHNPEDRNKILYFLFAVSVLALFGFISITPFSKGLPFSHIGALLSSSILAYAVVTHELISIDLVMRRALGWLSVIIIAIAIFESILIVGHFLFGVDLTRTSIMFSTIAALAAIYIVYWLRPIFLEKIDQLFYRKRYQYKKDLMEFVSHKMRGVQSLQELGEGLLTPLVKTLDCHQAFILLPEKEEGHFTVRFVEPQSKTMNYSLKIRKDSPIIHALPKQYLTRKDLEIRPEFRGVWTSERSVLFNAGIELLFPLLNHDNLVGILALGKKNNGKYSLEDTNLIEGIANQVAISLEKEYYQSELAKREKELSIINRLTRVITSSLNIQEVYDTFIGELRQTVNIDFAAIGLLDDDKINFSAVYNRGALPWHAGDKFDIRGSGLEWIVIGKKSLIYPDSQIDPNSTFIGQLARIGIYSAVFLPLITKDEVIGILSLASFRINAYSHEQVQFLEQLASQVATSVINAELYSKAEKRARIDELTQLSNRRHFDEMIDKEIHRHFRYGNQLSLILMDLDNFKSYNDLMGHINGDKLLKRIGQIILESIRNVDLAFRYGGDEFAIILPNTPVEDGQNIAERIRINIEHAMNNDNVLVTASIGLAGWPNDGITTQEIITAADQALYHAKRTGQNRVCLAAQLLPSPLEHAGHIQPLEKETLNTIYALAATIEARDRYTYGHSRKVRTYAVALAEAMGLPPEKVAVISHAALLHDIGKIGIYDTILNKPGALTSDERELIKSHPELSRTIVAHIPNLTPCLPAILHHHERWDGNGYPAGLKGEKIPIEARILTVADSFDAMTSARPYRNPLPADKVIEELKNGAGVQFDPKVIEAFMPIAIKVLGELESANVVAPGQ